MRRNVGLFFVCGLVLPLVVAASAAAQGANIVVTPKTARVGETVNLRTFNGSYTNAAGSSGVVIRDGTRTGRVLRNATADSRGNINVDFPLPGDLQPGWHLLVAVQTIDANNRQRGFLPGRTRLLVTAAAGGSAVPGGRGGLPDSPLGLLALGSALVLLATGAALTTRKLRTLKQPPLGNWPTPTQARGE